jgi:hypothetical protein
MSGQNEVPLSQRDLELMIEAWMLPLDHYSPCLQRMGKKFAPIAAVDASLIKLSLAAFNWAGYREKTGAAKITCVLDWMRGAPNQFVFTATSRVYDLKAAAALKFCERRCSGITNISHLFQRIWFSLWLCFLIHLKTAVDQYR